jgi:hypothetical protein
MTNSSYEDSLVFSSMQSEVKIFTDYKPGKTNKGNQSEVSLLKLFKKNAANRPYLGFEQDIKVFAAEVSSIQQSHDFTNNNDQTPIQINQP